MIPLRSPSQASSSGPILPQRLYSFALRNATGFFSDGTLAERCWDASNTWLGGSRDGITDQAGRANIRLKQFLLAAPTKRLIQGRQVEKIPRMVLIGLPEHIYRIDQGTGGIATYTLITDLTRLHSEEFKGDILDEKRGVVYSVVPHEGDHDLVMAWTGPSIFIPSERDHLLERLSITWADSDGLEHSLPEPRLPVLRVFNDEVVPDSLPVGRHSGQRYLLLGRSYGEAAIPLPRWFAGTCEGSAFIDLEAQDDASSGRGDGSVVAVQSERTVDTRTGVRKWTFTAAQSPDRPGDIAERLIVTLTPMAKTRPEEVAIISAPPAPPPVIEEMPGLADNTERGTIIVAPRRRPDPSAAAFRLYIIALALPRIDGACRLDGLRDYRILIDGDGRLVQQNGPDRIGLGGRAASPVLHCALPGKKEWEKIAILGHEPTQLPLANGGALALYPPPAVLASRYLALLRLQNPVPVSLPADRPLIIGRSDDGIPSTDHIVFNLLDLPATLNYESDPNATLEQVGLSRRHLSAEISDGRLRLHIHEGRAPCWQLDPDDAVIGALNPGETGTLELEPGHGLLLGCYLAVFRAPPL